MKSQTQKILYTLLLIFGMQVISNAQDTLKIHTSAQCETCKKKLEHDLRFEKGVESVNLNVENKILTVVYIPNKTNPEKIRIAISKIGYDADSVAADTKAYQKLNDCCKKGGH